MVSDEHERGRAAEEENFAALLAEHEGRAREGVIEGVVIELKDNEAYVDIARKAEGVLDLAELDGAALAVGDRIKVAVVGYRGGRSLLSHKKALRKEKVIEFIRAYEASGGAENEQNHALIDVKIIGKNKGGLVVVNADGVEFFLPRSQYGARELSPDKPLRVKIIKIDPEEQSIVVSRKHSIEEDKRRKGALLDELATREGVINGVVRKVASYGIFVDVGGADGLAHFSELSHKGPVNPHSLYKEGDSVAVKIIRYDKEKRQLSLSVKAALPDPWAEVKDSLEPGDTIKVVVSNIEPYGAFVDLGNDIEGFLHVSEISWDKNIRDPKKYLSQGEELDVEVLEIDTVKRRLRVSLRNLLTKPFDEFRKKYKVGDILEGELSSITSFGAFVRIGSVEGLLHNEDASWAREKCEELFKVGDTVRVKIIRIDEANQKISLSTRELGESPVAAFAQSHRVGEAITGQVVEIKDFGVFVSLASENGVKLDALIPRDELSQEALDGLKIGDQIEAAIAQIDTKRNKIRLSLRDLARAKERAVLEQINKDDKPTLGDVIKDQLS